MLVYRDEAQSCRTSDLLQELRSASVDSLLTRSGARDRLIEYGEFESALLDTLHPMRDGADSLTLLLRQIGLGFGKAFLHAARGEAAAAQLHGRWSLELLHAVHGMELPDRVLLKRPEGYAYWGLYPEQYVDAATRCYARFRPQEVIVIGLRSIGTSLASVVEASFSLQGVSTSSYTLRPRGHPFERRVQLGAELSGELRERRERLYLVVDEGPGLSGSSIASVVTALEQLGISPDSIVLLPSHEGDAEHFVNAEAARIWRTHQRVVGHFELGSLSQNSFEPCVDISAGKWRQCVASKRPSVAIQPQHERVKFLYLAPDRTPVRVRRFCGFAKHGRNVHARALQLQGSGVCPKVLGFADGMLELEFVAGNPMCCFDIDCASIDSMAGYLVYRSKELRFSDAGYPSAILEMARNNVHEALGEAALLRLLTLEARVGDDWGSTTCVDARMFPHEWVRTKTGLFKVDGFDHGDDHFYPGPCDIAWDVAGALTELDLLPEQRRALLQGYVARSGDVSIGRRLPFYAAAYLAFRVGYCNLACSALGTGKDGRRFARLAERYRTSLLAVLRSARVPSRCGTEHVFYQAMLTSLHK